jgi:hypothetical protein
MQIVFNLKPQKGLAMQSNGPLPTSIQQRCVWWIVKITHTSLASSLMNSADLIIFLDTGQP